MTMIQWVPVASCIFFVLGYALGDWVGGRMSRKAHIRVLESILSILEGGNYDTAIIRLRYLLRRSSYKKD